MLPSFNTVMNSFIKYAATQERSSLANLSQHIIPFHVIIWLVDQWETKKRNIRSSIEISSQFQWFCLSSACRFGYSSNCRYIVFQNIWMVVETGCTWTSHYNTSKTTIKPAAPDYTAFQTQRCCVRNFHKFNGSGKVQLIKPKVGGLINLDRTGPMDPNWPIARFYRPLLGEWRPLWPITIYIGS